MRLGRRGPSPPSEPGTGGPRARGAQDFHKVTRGLWVGEAVVEVVGRVEGWEELIA